MPKATPQVAIETIGPLMLPLPLFLIRFDMNRLVFNLCRKSMFRPMIQTGQIKTIFFLSLASLIIPSWSCESSPIHLSNGPLDANPPVQKEAILTGAEQMDLYLELLYEHGRVAVCTNHSALVKGVHLVDTLRSHGVNIVKIFGPEHGFRGMGDAGEKMGDQTDPKTGLPVISLYGKNKKPTPDQLKGIDIMVFDIQDVGARFYTYISTMHYVMEACAQANIPVVILDRPNPNGHYVDGPVLESAFKSFVGMHPIPVVHGLTVGELAGMIKGEKWLEGGIQGELYVFPCKGYTHSSVYQITVPPSPNLKDQAAVLLYPSLCFFEGTVVSVGRGTERPFTMCGYPDSGIGEYYFTPVSLPGAKSPPHLGKKCRGLDLYDRASKFQSSGAQLDLSWLLQFVQSAKDPKAVINNPKFFDLLFGTDSVRHQILAGATEQEIRASWQPKLQAYKALRKKYLLYTDFE